jgi:hypothetical protein
MVVWDSAPLTHQEGGLDREVCGVFDGGGAIVGFLDFAEIGEF